MATKRLSKSWEDYAPPSQRAQEEAPAAASSSEPSDLTFPTEPVALDDLQTPAVSSKTGGRSSTVSGESKPSPSFLDDVELMDMQPPQRKRSTIVELKRKRSSSRSKARPSLFHSMSSSVSQLNLGPEAVQLKSFTRIYSGCRPPEVLRRWGVPAPHAHVNWDDLFFDLVYVAVAYKLGVMLSYSIEEGYAFTGALYVGVIFWNVFNSWRGLMEYNARFSANDAIHKVYNDVVITLGTACIGLHVPYGSVSEFWDSNYHYELGILFGLLLDRLSSLVRWYEVYRYRYDIWQGWWSKPTKAKGAFQTKWDGNGLTPLFSKPDAPSTIWQEAVIVEKVQTDDAENKLPNVPAGTWVYGARILVDNARVYGLHHRRLTNNGRNNGQEVKSQTIRKVMEASAWGNISSSEAAGRSVEFDYRDKKWRMNALDDGYDEDDNPCVLEKNDIVVVSVRPAYEQGENSVYILGRTYIVGSVLFMLGFVYLCLAKWVWYPEKSSGSDNDDSHHRRKLRRHLSGYSYSSYSSYGSYSSSYSSYYGGKDDGDDYIHPYEIEHFWVHFSFVVLLGASHIFDTFWVLSVLICSNWWKQKAVTSKPRNVPPIHLDYAIERYGEWVMYMLGASVLNLVLVENQNTEHNQTYYSVFFAGFILAEFILNMYYQPEVFDSEMHAMHRTKASGWSWTQATKYYSMFLIMLGAGIRMMLTYVDEGYETPAEAQYGKFLIKLVCISTLAIFALQFTLINAHRGGTMRYFQSAWFHPTKDYTYVALNTTRIASVVGTIMPMFMPDMPLQAVAWLLSAMAGLQWVCLKIDLVYHEAAVFHSQKVLSRRLNNIKKQGPTYLDKNVNEMGEEMLIASTLGITAEISSVYKEAHEARKKLSKMKSFRSPNFAP